ncbi:hypothetical protein HARCEL1_11650 [Halococcoides cellulosivorans]|uniref:Right handed beta helix domain-containing protein n=2 Tax=Halococcoides cellulosivorans TaxID=1679096 RepID=A0A2R4X3N5_9EURY|nr:hypothetical protein HARCEL1_11650 [Halococcoides cellulosivorans]
MGLAAAGLTGIGLGVGSALAAPDRVELVAPRDETVDYEFTVAGSVERVTRGFTAAESDDEITTAGGVTTVAGTVADGYGDAFDVVGPVQSLTPADRLTLYRNGERVPRDDLVQSRRLAIQTPPDGSVEYEFTTTGPIEKVLTGDGAAEVENDTVEGGDTWTARGLTGNGYGDTYRFAGSVTSFAPMAGPFSLSVDGEPTTAYELTGERPPADRAHTYSVTATGSESVEYFIEVEPEGAMVPATADGARVVPDRQWVSADGTRAAGLVAPGETHAVAFDTLLLDVTVRGEADPLVDGSPSNLDWYPRPDASGDGWKSGFDWQTESADDGEPTDGDETTDDETTDDESDDGVDRAHTYSVAATGTDPVDYYVEVDDGGAMVSASADGATADPAPQWTSADGTLAAGRVAPGETHAVAFDTPVLDVTIEGSADALVDGTPSDLTLYPHEGATGDHWKGYFPWHIAGEQRAHTYAVAATGSDPVDYYIEVEPEGGAIPSTVDGARVAYRRFVIDAAGEKIAGRALPGETHAFAFDTPVLDVTIVGEADALVDGSPSNLDWYPRPAATGDGWKSGFPWHADGEGVTDETDEPSTGGAIGIRHDRYEGPIGGGSGMPAHLVHTASEADHVVSDGNVDAALASSSAGDLIYVEGSAGGFTVDVPGVTIAGNRGIGSDGQIRDEVVVTADDVTLDGLAISPGGGAALTVRGQHATFFNCAFTDASDMGIRMRRVNSAATFTQCKFSNFSGYGFHNNYNAHDEAHKVTIEYSEFSDLGRHFINAENAWYHVRDNHTFGSIGLDPDHFVELRAPNEYRTSQGPNACGSPSGNAIVEHNRHEIRGSGGAKTRLVVVRGEPTDGVWVRNNVSPGNAPASGGCWERGTHGHWGTQIVLQNASSTDDLSKVYVENNER